MTELVTLGWLTTDDIVLEDDRIFRGVPGGGALYSAVGAQIWNPSVGVNAPAGRPHAERSRAEIAARGLDIAGVATAEGNGLELWLLHEGNETKQQVRKLTSSRPLDLDAARGPLPDAYRGARGIHIAPQGPESSIRNAAALGAPGRVITMDILADEMIDARLYADLSFLAHIDAFLPSEVEVRRIWRPESLERWLADTARAAGRHVAAKRGERGSIIAEAGSGRLVHVPAFPARLIDTTGAGDGYCGGFLAGLAGGCSLAHCGAMGTVSASFVIEAVGALATDRPAASERDARLRHVLAGVRQIEPGEIR